MTTTGSTSQAFDATWSRDLVSLRTSARQLVKASYESSSITLEEYAEKVISYAESSDEINRRAAVDRRIRILRDEWGPLLKASFENWVTPMVRDAVLGKNHDHLDLSRNPAKHIWEELSVTYKTPPLRTTPKQADDVQKYLALLDGTHFDFFWQLVELLLMACNDVLIWPDVIQRREKKLKHRCAVPNVFTLVTTEDDPTEIECVVILDNYFDLDGKEHTKYKIWTDAWHAEFEKNSDGKLDRTDYVNPDITPESDNSAANPYGRIPMIHLRAMPWPDRVLDQTSGEDLIDLTLRTGEARLFHNYVWKMSGFKQGVVTGASIDNIPQQLLDPGALIRIEGDNASAQQWDWQVDLKSRQDCMERDELSAAAARGINPKRYQNTSDYGDSAGAQRAERGLNERRMRNAMILGPAEAEYKKHVCIVCAAHKMDNVPDPDVLLEVNYAPMIYPDSPQAQAQSEDHDVSLGLESHVSMMMKRHPEWTEDQARKAIEKNWQDIEWVQQQKVTHNIPNNPTNEGQAAEQNGRMGPIVRDMRNPGGSKSPPNPDEEPGVTKG